MDDQTGYSRGDVTIVKNADGTYSGTLTAIRPMPYKPLVEVCLKRKGKLKYAPLVSLEVIKGFKADPSIREANANYLSFVSFSISFIVLTVPLTVPFTVCLIGS